MELTPQQLEALRVFRDIEHSEAPLTAAQIVALEHLTVELVAFDDVQRLKQFARDTAAVNPHLLTDIESGLIRPCRALTTLMDSYYADSTPTQNPGTGSQRELFAA